ncbi:MAG: M14 family zinc carboxypeptidase, partial [Myxococcota bacterium]
MNWSPYRGHTYLDFPQLQAWCAELAEALPQWVSLATLGHTRQGRPLLLLTLGRHDPDRDHRPTLWIDAGTHASEWTSCMAALYVVSSWAEQLQDEDPAHNPLRAWFSQHTVAVAPCVSPDGFQALHDGQPFLRSSLRPPRYGSVQAGFEPRDIDGDGAVRWMRWRHPAGPVVPDPDLPLFMRPRTLDDDPDEA